MEDLGNSELMQSIAPRFETLFDYLREVEEPQMTMTRSNNLAEKRRDKGPNVTPTFQGWAGPDAPPFTDEEKRIVSISNPDVHSGSQEHHSASLEHESQQLGNLFCHQCLKVLYGDKGVQLNWVTGRAEKPVLKWRHR